MRAGKRIKNLMKETMTIEVLRTRGLPFSLMTTTHGLLIVSDATNDDPLFTYCPKLGVMRGLGDFDARPSHYTPKYLQLFEASVEDLRRMKLEWEAAAEANTRYGTQPRNSWPANAPPPYMPALGEPISPDTNDPDLAALNAFCAKIE